MGDQVWLRPVDEDDLSVLEALTQDPEMTGEFGWFGWSDPLRYRRQWTENRLLGGDGGTLMVVRPADRLGFVTWRRRRLTPAAHGWRLGVALLPDTRGQGIGTEAHRLLARYLFAHTPVHRLDADTEADNLAEQRALEKAGFTREGIMRGCAWRDGAWRDGVTYSLLRTDPPV